MHLLKGKTLNQAQAAKLFGAWRLSAIIFNLKKEGYIIKSVNEKGEGSHWAKYKYRGKI